MRSAPNHYIFVKKMKNLETHITINSSASKVWEVLTDTLKYASWNPFIIKVEGEFKTGQTVKNTLHLNGKDNVFEPEIVVCKSNEQLRWIGKLPLGMFTGEHYFTLKEIAPNQTVLTHGENFSGWLSGLILWQVGANTKRGFEAMNRALKQRVEGMK